MKPLKERVCLTVDGDVLESIRRLAEERDRSLSQFVNIILRDYVNHSDEKTELNKKLD